jgi:CheY-like chemotaxis protein
MVYLSEMEKQKSEIKILVAEDNKVNRLITKSMLELFGYTVFIARNGENAFELYKMYQPDAILMDIEMPVLNGVDTILKIRKYEQNQEKKTPIIAVTAHSRKEQREEYYEAGINDYLSKPFKPFELSTILKKFGL